MKAIWINILLTALFSITVQGQCPVRNTIAAAEVGRVCRRRCTPEDNRCRRGGECMCAHECGYSCINPANFCPTPPTIPRQSDLRVFRKHPNGSYMPGATPPYMFDDIVEYVCEPGYSRESPPIRHYCHGRRSWTQLGSTICARSCQSYSFLDVLENGMNCGRYCVTDNDCVGQFRCLCDGPCGRSCCNPSVNCGLPPSSQNAKIQVKGQGFYQVAHYTCDEGYYVFTGNRARKCTGGGSWDGKLISCQRVKCGDPAPSIRAMGGQVLNGAKNSYYVGDQVTLGCRSYHRLLGDRVRTCMSNGQWSGRNTVCDAIDQLTRCPHPGVPINGEVLTGGGFGIGRTVEFSCDSNYTMIGEKFQECLYFLQWSDDSAPRCLNPRYEDPAFESVERLKLITARIQEISLTLNLGNALGGFHSDTAAEVYFVIDISNDVKPDALNSSIQFAEYQANKIARGGLITGSVLAFASTVSIEVELRTRPVSHVIRSLRKIIANRQNLLKALGSQRNTFNVLMELNKTLADSYSENKLRERLLLLFVNGKHSEGMPPHKAMESIRATYQESLEAYVISFGENLYKHEDNVELRQLGSTFDRFLPNPKVTRLLFFNETQNQDHNQCGTAGDIGNVKKQARIGNILGGFRAAEGSWPWQVAIAELRPSIFETYRALRGGGSVINNQWVLTAAHVVDSNIKVGNWTRYILLTFGLHKLPTRSIDQLPAYVQVFDAAEILIHSNYSRSTFDYDIALIKIGRQLKQVKTLWELTGNSGWVNYTTHIRPVCLPCMEGNCAREYLQKRGLINKRQTEQEKCEVEGNWLTQHDDRDQKNILAIITGFGHTQRLSPFDGGEEISTYLKQGLIRLKKDSSCQHARDVMLQEGLPPHLAFTDQMLCGVGGSAKGAVDACRGDSGGALVREVRDEETGKNCWVEIGIVSWGWGCGLTYKMNGVPVQFPAYYANILSLLPWIKQRIVPPVVLTWSVWETQGNCSVTCGGGNIQETRRCLNKAGCSGPSTRHTSCNTNSCPAWSAWRVNGTCSVTCGEGKVRFTRTCLNGRSCSGNNTRSDNCMLSEFCPEWSNWRSTNSCSVSCGGGQISQTRQCRNGPGCQGESNRMVPCNTQLCPEWSSWNKVGSCSVTCGKGMISERRRCSIQGGCSGIANRDLECNTQPCPVWSKWVTISQCDATCGGGRRLDRRRCLNGRECKGKNSRRRVCNTTPCPSWSSWIASGSCSTTCGRNGKRTETRRCMNGRGCSGISRRRVDCNTQACPEWSNWRAIGSCSVSCAGGIQSETRQCLNGPGCNGLSSRSVDCNVQPCPVTRPTTGSIQVTTKTISLSSSTANNVTSIPAIPVGLSCTFDSETFCGWNHDAGDFQWRLRTGTTPSSRTGPLYDHTTQSGWYIYIEASSPRIHKHQALLRSSPISNTNPICLRFYYHMYGSTIGKLEVLTARIGEYRFSVKWSAKGQQSKNTTDWLFAEVDVAETFDYEIVLRGIRGTSFYSDIAVDDVTILPLSCNSSVSSQVIATTVSSTHISRNEWSVWSSIERCSVTCGGGRQPQTRRCNNGPRCIGDNRRTVECNIGACPEWSSWSSTSGCSLICGGGRRSETRQCNNGPGCIGKNRRSVECNTQRCPEWSSWTTTGSCDASCGGGRDSETRRCVNGPGCNGTSVRLVDCNTQACSAWSSWAATGICSVTCGSGKQLETRQCLNGNDCTGITRRFVDCSTQACPVWSSWTSSGSCSTSCGEGFRLQTRVCLNGRGCRGENNRQVDCGIDPCSNWSDWTTIRPCSLTCGRGVIFQTRVCLNGNNCKGPSSRRIECNTQPCASTWGEWISVGQCTAECGRGSVLQRRECLDGNSCDGNLSTRIVDCNVQPCSGWGEWKPIFDCSVTCGQGFSSEIRKCYGGNCVGEKARDIICNEQPCANPHWSEWRSPEPCSSSCDGGLKLQARTCIDGPGCEGEKSRIVDCNTHACSSWSSWEAIEECSRTCGFATRTESRRCRGGNSCIGENKRTIECLVQPCPTWGDWQSLENCPVTCGSGRRTEIRQCLNGPGCSGDNSRIVSCNAHSCETPADWGEWTTSAACDVSCGGGSVLQIRNCLRESGCDGSAFRYIPCNSHACSEIFGWSEWTTHGVCSVSCGGGTLAQTRNCLAKSCTGSTFQIIDCNTHPCRISEGWSEWESVGSCDRCCGGGSILQIRTCLNNASNGACDGKNSRFVSCNTQPCTPGQNEIQDPLNPC